MAKSALSSEGLVFYHGGTPGVQLQGLSFFSLDTQTALSYLTNLSDPSAGHIYEVRLAIRNAARDKDVIDAARAIGVTPELWGRTWDEALGFEYLSPHLNPRAADVAEELKRRGFDGAHFKEDFDLGGRLVPGGTWTAFEADQIKVVQTFDAELLAIKPISSNELYLDASLRHQIGIRRYSAGVATRIANLLEEADAELVMKLRTRLARFEGKSLDFTGERWKALLEEIRKARADTLTQYKQLVRGELGAFAVHEGDREVSLLNSAIPIEFQFATVASDQLRAISTARPFQGKLLRDWFQELEQQDQRRITQILQLGMVQGETTDQIVRQVVGTQAAGFTDGALSITRRNATAIMRTAINHVSNVARSSVWEANQDVIGARIWVSTLDGRTTAICRARDGQGSPVGDSELPEGIDPLVPSGAEPPAHINCRSIMVAYIDGVGLVGNRPTVVDDRTRAQREVDFRAIAKRTDQPIQDVRADWANRTVGQVPATTTYQQFLERQSAEFQDKVLGKTKGQLFRKGDLQLDEFVDRAGNELTLDELAQTQPEAFLRAGLDPADF